MKDYSFLELKDYIIEDFEEFINQWNYSIEQACARIIDEYDRGINNSYSQKAVIYVCLARLAKEKGTIPEIIITEIIKIKTDFSQELYSEMTENEFIMFTEELNKV